jgi:hypothetical protein
MASAGDPAQDAEKDEQTGDGARPEREAHGSTPPHGDPLAAEHAQTGGGRAGSDHGAPEPEWDSGTAPHGDPLET